MQFGDKEFNQTLASAISNIEKGNRELEQLKSQNNSEALMKYICLNYLKALPEDVAEEIMNNEELTKELIAEVTENTENLQDLLAYYEKKNAVALSMLDRLLAKAKDEDRGI